MPTWCLQAFTVARQHTHDDNLPISRQHLAVPPPGAQVRCVDCYRCCVPFAMYMGMYRLWTHDMNSILLCACAVCMMLVVTPVLVSHGCAGLQASEGHLHTGCSIVCHKLPVHTPLQGMPCFWAKVNCWCADLCCCMLCIAVAVPRVRFSFRASPQRSNNLSRNSVRHNPAQHST